MKKNSYKKIFFVIALFFIFSVKTVFAANLYIEANSTQAKIGDIVTATVYVNADGTAINNVEGLISVPSDALEIQSISTSGSILNLWVEQPTYSKGSITFNGGIPNPGYSGSKGKVVTIFMKALKSGNTSISFQSANVRANDGLGTDVLKSKFGTTVNVVTNTVIKEVPTPVTTPATVINSPSAPIVSSSLAPDSDKWYQTDATTFSWKLPNGVSAVKTLFDQKTDTEPSVVYSPAISKKTIENLEDGVWYFHIKYQNEAGWGKASHKKIQIDNSVPGESEITYKTLESGLIEISLFGNDDVSSISKFVLYPEGKEKVEVTNVSDGRATYVFGNDYSGTKKIKIETYDQAGNYSESSIEIYFPTVEAAENKPVEVVEEKTAENNYLVWGNKIISLLSVIVPILAIILLILAIIYGIFKRFILVDRSREKRIEKIEKEAMYMIDVLRDNIKEDIHLFKADKNINNIDEAEKVLLNNLLLDFKHIEKAINTRLRKGRLSKKDQQIVDD